MTKEKDEDITPGTLVKFSLLALGLMGLIAVGGCFGCPAYTRYQTVQDANNRVQVATIDANNRVQVTAIEIQNQTQLVEVENRKAEVRVADARGIADSQKIIDSSLTLNYLQYLAIQAQTEMAHSPNHSEVYIPVGTNGIPLVRTVNPSGEEKK
jgi:hypothetical protein